MQKLAANLTEKNAAPKADLAGAGRVVRLSCGVQARTDALLFRTDCTRLPDRTALGSTTAELGRRVFAPQGERAALAYVRGLYAFLAVL